MYTFLEYRFFLWIATAPNAKKRVVDNSYRVVTSFCLPIVKTGLVAITADDNRYQIRLYQPVRWMRNRSTVAPRDVILIECRGNF